LQYLLRVSVLNVGTAPSYISSTGSISLRVIVDGKEVENSTLLVPDETNPEPGACVEPGRKLVYHFYLNALHQRIRDGQEVFPVEVLVTDEIGNVYSAPIPENLREELLVLPKLK
jgi:hypothetical protein